MFARFCGCCLRGKADEDNGDGEVVELEEIDLDKKKKDMKKAADKKQESDKKAQEDGKKGKAAAAAPPKKGKKPPTPSESEEESGSEEESSEEESGSEYETATESEEEEEEEEEKAPPKKKGEDKGKAAAKAPAAKGAKAPAGSSERGDDAAGTGASTSRSDGTKKGGVDWEKLGEAVSKKGGKKEAAFYEKVNRAHKAKDSSFGWPASFMPMFLGTKEGADGGVRIAMENVLKGYTSPNFMELAVVAGPRKAGEKAVVLTSMTVYRAPKGGDGTLQRLKATAVNSELFSSVCSLEGILSFFMGDGETLVHKQVVTDYLSQFKVLRMLLLTNRMYKFVGCSLLLIHSGDRSELPPKLLLCNFDAAEYREPPVTPADKDLLAAVECLIQALTNLEEEAEDGGQPSVRGPRAGTGAGEDDWDDGKSVRSNWSGTLLTGSWHESDFSDVDEFHEYVAEREARLARAQEEEEWEEEPESLYQPSEQHEFYAAPPPDTSWSSCVWGVVAAPGTACGLLSTERSPAPAPAWSAANGQLKRPSRTPSER